MAEFGRCLANDVNVRGALDERLTHRIDTVLKRELEAFPVPRRKGRDTEINARQVHPFA